MKLNHLNLTVSDAAESAAFLRKYFGLRSFENGPPDKPTMAFVKDDNGMVVGLLRGRRECEEGYPSTFHIGFIQESEDQVNEINARLKADGFEVPPPARLHGSWTFFFQAPGGFTVEVLV